MANTTFQLKRSSVAGKQPNTSTLSIGELALNITDKKIYSSDGSNIFEPAANVTNQNITASLTVASSFTVNSSQITISGTPLSANGGTGSSGQVLTTNGATGAPYWSTVSSGGTGIATVVRQEYTANGTQNTFTVTGGYTANNLDVYLNGIKLYNGAEVNVASGSTFTILTGNPANGSLIEIVGGLGYNTSSSLTIGNVVIGLDQISVGNSSVNTQVVAGNVYLNGSTLIIGNTVSNITANSTTLSIGTTTLNSSSFTGSSNNASYLGGTAASGYQTTAGLSANVATLTANNTSFVGSVSAANVVSNTQLSSNLANYQTTAGLSANVATLTANNTSFVGTVSAANVVSNAQLSSNLANYVTTTNLTNNLANYQTTADLSANVATLTANNTSFVGTVSAANVVSNAQLSSNLGNYAALSGATFTGNVVPSANNNYLGNTTAIWNVTANNVNAVAISGNGVSVTSVNAAALVGYTFEAPSVIGSTTANGAVFAGVNVSTIYATTSANIASAVQANATGVYTTGTVNAVSLTTGATGTGTGGAVVNTTVMFLGNNTINAQINTTTLYIGGNVIANSTGANNAFNLGGTAASGYQTTAGLNANIAAYLPTYTGVVNASSHTVGTTFVANTTQIVISGVPLSANGNNGTSGQVLTSNGNSGAPYWSTVSGGGFTNGQSISVNNFVITGNLTANSANGIVGNVLMANGTGVFWGNVGATTSTFDYGSTYALKAVSF